MTRLSVELVKDRLLKEDEVKKAQVAKLKLSSNRKSKEIKNPTAGQKRSERFDTLTQVVQDPNFTADVPPKNTKDFIPTAQYAKDYTDNMPHGSTSGTGIGKKGENQKSPKIMSTKGMKPNQATKLKEIPGAVQGTEDDDSKIFAFTQAKYAKDYTDAMPHGGQTLKASSETGGEPPARSYDKTNPTRGGGKRDAKLGGDIVGSTTKDSQHPTQVTHSGKFSPESPDALKWGGATWGKEKGGHNVVESGVIVSLKGKQKATYEVVSTEVLKRIAESYSNLGYDVEFTRTEDVSWKKDRKFLTLLRESINAGYNFAPKYRKALRRAALKRLGSLVQGSYNSVYESRQEFVETVVTAFKKIEEIAETKYLKSLDVYECQARVKLEGEYYDIPAVTEATGDHMALRQIRNRMFEDYGFDTEIKHIFIDGRKYTTKKIEEYAPNLNQKKS